MSSKESKSVTTKIEKKETGKGIQQVTSKQTSTGSKIVGKQDSKSVEDVKGGKLVTTTTEQKTAVVYHKVT
ncbi:hypothetical protein KUTeg_023788 [Tegillarca granosa]|uniref:Uncharacterized protein n=1 Tax=Tegillarca granosa TaxID=220873 RepID=A0ABQ9E8T7_TEGGR|nr:hypothetical protein KUTeg_023788 [Tegillarca granosa]